MKPIKLLTLTSRNYLVIFLGLTAFFFAVFYFITQREVVRSTDEVLYNRKIHLLDWIQRSGIPTNDTFQYTDFIIAPAISSTVMADVYSDTLIYETVDKEWDEFRKLTTLVESSGKSYQLTIMVARLETHEIVETILTSLAVVFLLMVAAFYFATRYLSQKLWEPFYQTLAALNRFEMDHFQEPVLSAGRIEEFMFLNKSILDLTNRTRAAFLDQKQFIENASHEMQTPLAITQSKLELLIADQHLTEQQAEIIQTLLHSTQRLARLNKSLLLLSKIENQQFPQKERIILRPLLDEILTNFEEQQATHHLTLEITEQNTTSLYADKTLVDLLLTNLVKNAFFHNRENGAIHIDMTQHHFSIRNTSSSPAIPTAHLYQRFYKQSTTTKDSWGLGLAMAKKICDINEWKISYSHEGDEHLFVITF